jgi:hypothetical protein
MNFIFLFLITIISFYALYKFKIFYKKDDKKICEPGFAGSNCQFSDKITCNNRGKVSANENDEYKCDCKINFEGKNCHQCNKSKGYVGQKCLYNDFYCNNNGKVNVDVWGNPSCDCKSEEGWYGERCNLNEFILPSSFSSRCNNKGYYNPTISSCDCINSYGKFCQFDNSYCGAGGYITNITNMDSENPNIECTCFTGYAGKRCQYNNSICSNRGDVYVDNQDNPKCDCYNNFNYTGKYCKECKDGFFGTKEECKYSKEICNGGILSFRDKETDVNPTPSPSSILSAYDKNINFSKNILSTDNYSIACVCPKGDEASAKKEGKKSGSKCQLDDNTLCNNRGYIEEVINETSNPPIIKCTCLPQYDGDRCELLK